MPRSFKPTVEDLSAWIGRAHDLPSIPVRPPEIGIAGKQGFSRGNASLSLALGHSKRQKHTVDISLMNELLALDLDLSRFDSWRQRTVEEVQEWCVRPGWERATDDAGRNLLMQACAFFAPPGPTAALFQAAHQQGLMAQVCAHEDAIGSRLAAYVLRHLHKEWVGHDDGYASIFTHEVINNSGHGLLRQILDLDAAERPSEPVPTLTLRGVGFDRSHVGVLSPGQWSAGLDGDEEHLLQWWFGRVMENEMSLGVAFSPDLHAMNDWIVPLFEQTSREAWSPILAQCLDILPVLNSLLFMSNSNPPAWILDQLKTAPQTLVAHRHRWGEHFLIERLLAYHGYDGVWRAFLEGNDLGEGSTAAHRKTPLNRL